MTPEIDYERDGNNEGLFRVTVNGKRIGPPLWSSELCAVQNWLEQSWPELVVAVIAAANVEPKKKRKVRK